MENSDQSVQVGAFSQYKSLLIRNLILKKRERRKTLTEFLMPLYYILVLAIVRMIVKDTTYEAITEVHDGVPLMPYNKSVPILSGDIYVTPNTTQVKRIIDQLATVTGFLPASISYFGTENELLDDYKNNKNTVSVALILKEDPVANPVYTIRSNPRMFYLVPASTLMTPESQCRSQVSVGLESGFSCSPNTYFHTGFLFLQSSLDYVITKESASKDFSPAQIFLQSFPRNEYTSGGTVALRSVVPLYLVFAWAQFIIYMMILIVEEKEKKIKEGMKMMGLSGFVYWLSWVTIYFCYVVLLAIICIIILPLARVFVYANRLLLFILFILYGLSSIILALMLTPFFNKAKVAGIVGQLIQVSMSLLFYLQVYLSDKISTGTFWALGLLSPCAFSMALDKAILLDFSTGGLDWNTVWSGDGLPFAGSLIMISIDILLYLSLGFYFDNVVPSEYGRKQKPWFIFQWSTWCKKSDSSKITSTEGLYNNIYQAEYADDNSDIEPIPSELSGKEAVRIRNMHKIFKSHGKESVHAVNGISLDIYEGQITAILGHNGAGKTTLFNLLTGMISPSKGTALIFNYNLSSQRDLGEIRRLTGVCPQHDILFLQLTAREHLSFYARMKGVPSNLIKEKTEEMLQDIDLKSKADTIAEKLSGGQKRKLSIGIALIGDPKIIFLDEPTAGVDAYSRRHLWALLKKKKQGKVILLTTHFMDEADILADRKAIISRGKLRCCGTSMFLKNRFGLGYHLTLVMPENASTNLIGGVIQKIIPNADLARHYGKEVSFILPVSSPPKFPQLFSILDEYISTGTTLDGDALIESYGISMTTLEEVFLTLSEEKEEINSIEEMSLQIIKARSSSLNSYPGSGSSSPLTNASSQHEQAQVNVLKGFEFSTVQIEKSTWRAFRALLKLRFINTRREILAMVFLVIVPLGLVAASMALANIMTVTFANEDPIALNSELYSSLSNKVLVDNETGHSLTPFDEVLTEFGLSSSSYNGSYRYIYEIQSHFSAFNFNKFREKDTDGTIRFNSSFTHSLPILLNIITNSIYRAELNDSNQILQVTSQQLPLLDNGQTQFDVGSFFSPFMIGFVFTMIPAGLVIEIVYDREIKGRNMLRLNGVGFNLYFSSFFIVIGFLYFISYAGLLIIIQAFQVPSLVEPSAYATVALLYLVYMPSALLFSGCVSYIFDKQETARQFYPSIVTTLGFLSYTVVFIVDLLVNSDLSTYLHYLFTVFIPYYIPFGALYYVNKVYIKCAAFNACNRLTAQDYITKEIIFMFGACILDWFLFYILLRIVDTLKLGGKINDALWIKRKNLEVTLLPETYTNFTLNGDEDIREERDRVFNTINNPLICPNSLLFDLGKTYSKGEESKGNICNRKKSSAEFVAVKSMSFEVRPGEVFGLLGPNGAGKTTTLRIMTAEEAPTKGQAQICGYNITSSLSSAFENLGYCPQHDCLWKNVTVAEHIECYAEISGVREDQVKSLIAAYVKGLEIEEHKDKKSKDCSGGTKRKLSYIISMMGLPKMVLLDEPSTGMDPQSKRFLWNSILASFKNDRSAILTTHSMEEADTLCSRIGIVVRGEMRCLGSVQHLKNKYGSGYSLEMKLKSSGAGIAAEDTSIRHLKLKDVLLRNFPNSAIDEEFEERIIFKIPQSDIRSLGNVFSLMESLKNEGSVEEYALSQTTLEQVFLRFARQQEVEEKEIEDQILGAVDS